MGKQDEYKKLLSEYRETLAEAFGKPIEAEDIQLTNAVAAQKSGEEIEYNKRDNLYTDLLSNYIEIYKSKEKHKKIFKIIFFAVVMAMFVCVIVGCTISLYCISKDGIYDVSSVCGAIGSVTGMISAIIIIPQIIAKHLFPTNEEKFMLDMVKSMQNNDAGIRDFIYAEEKNEKESGKEKGRSK